MAYLLIVDDDEDFAGAVATTLRNAGHEVAVELEPARAVTSMENKTPDLVILDVMFPEDASAGFELARTIRHFNEKLKGIPVLMLTAVNARFPLGFGPRDIDDAWLPVSDFVEKPVDFNALLEKVNSLLQKSGSQAGQGGEQA